MVYKYCLKVYNLLTDPANKDKIIYHVTSLEILKRPNAAYLIGAFSVLYLGRTPDAAFRPLMPIAPGFHPFRDASYGSCSFKLTVLDCLRGLYQGMLNNFFDFSSFELDEYQYYERVENGDLNWIIPKKMLAFAGPHNAHSSENGYPLHAPEEYFEYFHKRGVEAIVRLNNKLYDRSRFVNAGFQHHDLFFIDGSVPPELIVVQFLEIAERTKGALAVHCKAGLGRTGTLIACYMMKHYLMSANECIAWLRIARPGSVLGPQQYFLQQQQPYMWQAGERIDRRRLEEDQRPAWSRAALLALQTAGGLPPDPPAPVHVASPKLSRPSPGVMQLSSAMRAMSIAPRPRASLVLPSLGSLASGPIDTGPDGKSQGDFLVAQKARRSRSFTTGAVGSGAMRLEGPLVSRTRNPSVGVALRVAGASMPSPALRNPGRK